MLGAQVKSFSHTHVTLVGTDETMSDYRQLQVWQKSREIAVEIYRVTSAFPRSEMFGLTQQMRRAAVSIACNIAEGHGRWTRRDCRSFLVIARGSALELETQLFIAEDLEFIRGQEAHHLRDRVTEIARMLNGLLRYYASAPEH